MDSQSGMMNLSLLMSATCLTLLVLSSWSLRTTSIGRSFLAFILVADYSAIFRLSAAQSVLGEEASGLLLMAFDLVMSATILRLACQIANDSAKLGIAIEALLVGIPAAVLLSGDAIMASLWSACAFGFAGVQVTQMPHRSWDGFRMALNTVSALILFPALFSLASIAGAPASLTSPATTISSTILAIGLFLCLPRLGFLSSDRVRHGSVIEAMCDGVLVVDMNDRLVEFNEAAREILELDEDSLSLRHLADVLAHHCDLVELFSGAIDGQSVYSIVQDSEPAEEKTYDLRLSALYDSTGSIRSRVMVLRDISDRIAIEEESRRQSRHVRIVHEVSAAVHEAHTIEGGLEAALSLIARAMNYSLGHFLRAGDAAGNGHLVASGIVYTGDREGADSISSDRDLADTLSGADPFADGEHASASRAVVDPRGVHWWKEFGGHPVLTLPLMIGPRLYGVFEFFDSERAEVADSTSEMLEHIGELIGRAVERKLVQEKIRRLAFRDDLTGLPNRQRFNHLLNKAVALSKRADRKIALLFMDLDGFKKVNDTLGHQVGDRLLAEVASRFSEVVRVSDHAGRQHGSDPRASISRLGGDEFTLLLTELQDPAAAALVASRLLATLESPILLNGQELFMSTSIGIAVYPDDGTDSESLLRNADAAMYFAKGRGRNGYQFYSDEMNPSRATAIKIESRLRGAVERDEFEVYYQPILDAESGAIVAAEALLRWPDEERGFIPPDEFIPVAEETGIIVSLGRWVLREACGQAQRWRDELGISLRIGVNVSGYQIREPGMLDMVRSALDDSGVCPDQVELEITESTIMQDDALTVATLRELKELGVGLALDDFGTGYSSLSYLRRFTIDRVKIDRSFVSELTVNSDDASLTGAIIAMAHGLRLKVVAEGVETEGQALFLQQRGCDELQGYLFGRPCPAVEFEDLLRAKPRSFEDLEEVKEDGIRG